MDKIPNYRRCYMSSCHPIALFLFLFVTLVILYFHSLYFIDLLDMKNNSQRKISQLSSFSHSTIQDSPCPCRKALLKTYETEIFQETKSPCLQPQPRGNILEAGILEVAALIMVPTDLASITWSLKLEVAHCDAVLAVRNSREVNLAMDTTVAALDTLGGLFSLGDQRLSAEVRRFDWPF